MQFQRQRGDREIDVLEFLARLRPFALAGIGEPLPQLRIVIVADRGAGEILQALPGPPDHDACDRVHHANDGFLGLCTGICEDDFGLALGLLIHAPRHIEPGEVEPGLRALIRLGGGNRQHQRVFAPDEPLRLIFLPLLDIENRPHRGRRALDRDACR